MIDTDGSSDVILLKKDSQRALFKKMYTGLLNRHFSDILVHTADVHIQLLTILVILLS